MTRQCGGEITSEMHFEVRNEWSTVSYISLRRVQECVVHHIDDHDEYHVQWTYWWSWSIIFQGHDSVQAGTISRPHGWPDLAHHYHTSSLASGTKWGMRFQKHTQWTTWQANWSTVLSRQITGRMSAEQSEDVALKSEFSHLKYKYKMFTMPRCLWVWLQSNSPIL